MKTNEEYKLLVLKRHGNKYGLENTVYKGMRNHVTAICPKHGNFSIYAYDFATNSWISHEDVDSFMQMRR